MATFEMENYNPVGRLKNVSITELQDAIAETLLRLAGPEANKGTLYVSIKTAEWNQYYNGLKLSMNVDWAPEFTKEAKSA